MSGAPVLTGFNYSDFPAPAVDLAKTLAQDLRSFHRRTVEEGAEFGRRLLEVRALLLDTKTFVHWIETEVGIGKSSAYRFITLAEAFSPGVLSHVGKLGPTIAYQVAAKTTPISLREQIGNRLAAGENLSGPAVVDMLHESRARAKMARDEARLTAKQRRRREARKNREARDWAKEQEEWRRQMDREEESLDHACRFLVDRLGADASEFLRLLTESSRAVRSEDVRRALKAQMGGANASC